MANAALCLKDDGCSGIYSTLQAKLNAALRGRGMSNEAVANYANLSVARVTMIGKGMARNVSLSEVAALAEAVGLQTRDLLSE